MKEIIQIKEVEDNLRKKTEEAKLKFKAEIEETKNNLPSKIKLIKEKLQKEKNDLKQNAENEAKSEINAIISTHKNDISAIKQKYDSNYSKALNYILEKIK